MKLFINIFITLIVIIVLIGIAAFIFISTFDLNKYINPISNQASEALGRQVNIGYAKLHLDIFKGIDLHLKNITIAEDEHFGKKDFVRLEALTTSLDVQALISRHEIVLTSVELSGLHVNIIRDEKGTINAQTIGPESTVVDQSIVQPSTPTSSTQLPSVPPSMPQLLVKNIRITNSGLDYEDKNPSMPLHIPINQIAMNIDNFSLIEPFAVTFKAAVLSKSPNVDVHTNVVLNIVQFAAMVKDLNATSDLALIDFSQFKTAMPSWSQIPWPTSARGAFKFKADPFTISTKGLSGIKAQANVDNFALNVLEYPLSLQSLSSNIDIDLSKSDLSGRVDVTATSGKIEHLNLTNIILSKLNGISVIGLVLSELVKGGLVDLALGDKTLINGAMFDSKFGDGVITINTFNLNTQPMVIDGQGNVQLKGLNVDVMTNISMSTEITQKLSKSAKPLQGLVNDKGSIFIPGRISGVIPKVSYSPDIAYITQKLGTSEAVDALGKQLDKVIEKNPEVGNILNAVFGKESTGTTQENAGESSKDSIKGFLNKVLK